MRGLEESDLVVLDVECEGRVLDLDGRDGVHSMRASERIRGYLGKAKMLDLPLPRGAYNEHQYSCR